MANTKPREYRTLRALEEYFFPEREKERQREEMLDSPEKTGTQFADELLAGIRQHLEGAFPEACAEQEAPH